MLFVWMDSILENFYTQVLQKYMCSNVINLIKARSNFSVKHASYTKEVIEIALELGAMSHALKKHVVAF